VSPEPGKIRKRSVLVAGHATSVSLENAFWDSLSEIARDRGVSVNALIAEIDQDRTGNLSSAVRVFVLDKMAAGGKNPGGGSTD